MFINRSFYDINDYKEHARYDDGFEKSQLQHFWRKSKDFYDHCLLNNNLDEDDQFVTYETTFACFVDQSKITQHCQNLCGIVLERIKSRYNRGLISYCSYCMISHRYSPVSI